MKANTIQPNISVGREAFREALKHGMELWWDDSTPKKRLDQRNGRDGFTRFVNARIEGKLAEVAFSRFLDRYYDIESQVDWRIYGDYNTTDNGDLEYLVGDDGGYYPPAAEFDVKKTKPWNMWLAIRSSVYRAHPDDAPFILTKLNLEEDLDVDEWEPWESWEECVADDRFMSRLTEYEDEHLPVTVELCGTAYKDEFTDHFDKGDRLYHPKEEYEVGGDLRMDNEGIPVRELNASPRRWNRVVREVVGDNPISWDGF